MPKSRRPATSAPARQSTAQPSRPEPSSNDLMAIFTDVSNNLQECGHEANQVLHHWLQLKKQIASCDTRSSPGWLGRVQGRLVDFATEAREEIEVDRIAKADSARKDSRIRDLEVEVTRLSDAAMVAEGNAMVERANRKETEQKLQEQSLALQKSDAALKIARSAALPGHLQLLRMKDADIRELKKRIARLDEHTNSLVRENGIRVARLEEELRKATKRTSASRGDNGAPAEREMDPQNINPVHVFAQSDCVAVRIRALYDRHFEYCETACYALEASCDSDDISYLSAAKKLLCRFGRLLQPLSIAAENNLRRRRKLIHEVKELMSAQLVHERDLGWLMSEYEDAWLQLHEELCSKQ